MQEIINLFLNKACIINKDFIELCDHHRVLSRAYPLLQKRQASIDPNVWQLLNAKMQQHTRTVLTQIHELTILANEFNAANIPLIAFKGLQLSYLLYGDYTRRQSKDIDILIHEYDFQKAHKMLLNLGYKRIYMEYANKKLNQRQEKYFLSTYKDWGYIHPINGTNIEMHRRLMPSFVKHINIDINEIWNSATQQPLFSTTIYSFSLEHLFLYLCTHGAISQWARMHWIVDLWDFLKKYQSEIDWNIVIETSKRWHTDRCVNQGLLLINQLFHHPIPDEIHRQVENNLSLRQLNKSIIKKLITPGPFNSFKHNYYFVLLFNSFSSKVLFLIDKIKYRINMRIRSFDFNIFKNFLYSNGKNK